MPEYDGELVLPLYGNWHDMPGYTEAQVRKGHATYCGEITMVDTWLGYLLKSVENMGIADKTVVIFTSDHGFYFGEHGGLFGKMSSDKYPDGTLRPYDEPGSQWSYSPLFEELVHLPLLIRAPGVSPGVYSGLSSAIDVMPTVLDLLGLAIPDFVQGRSLAPAMGDATRSGRDYVVSSIPFANPGRRGPISRQLPSATSRTLRSRPSLRDIGACYTALTQGCPQLYNLASDPQQLDNVIEGHMDEAREIHRLLVEFMRENEVPERLLQPRLELRM